MITLFNPLDDKPADTMPQDRQPGLLALLGMTVRIRTTAKESNGALGVVELTVSPHWRAMLPHCHEQTTEILYVLDGIMAFTVGEESFTGTRGRVVLILPQTVHHLWNPTASPATVLHLYTPGGFEAYFAELASICTAASIDPKQLLAIAAKYDQFIPPISA